METTVTRRERRWWLVAPRVFEAAVLVVLVLAAGAGIVALAVMGASWIGYLGPLLVLAGVGLSYRFPYPGLAIVVLAPLAVWWSGGEVPEATWSMVCFAAFILAFRGLPGLLVGVVLAVLNFVTGGVVLGTIDVQVNSAASVFASAALIGAAAGSAVRGNLRYRQAAEQRLHDAETVRLASVDRGVAQERLRIARDLHDSVGHQIAVVNMRLGAAEVHLPAGADQSRIDIAQAREAVQAVLRETQQILAVLRLGADDAQAGRIRDLVDGYRDAGMIVEADLADVDGLLSPQASIAAYRIVQEALTNAHRYGKGRASVTLTTDESGEVRIEVVNTRDEMRVSGGGGNGLVGMRERAASVGGTVEVRPDGALFWVIARLPMTKEM